MEETINDIKNFLRAGGSLSWKEWLGTEPDIKALFVEAAEQLDAERAALYGYASSREGGVERIFARVDGGESLVGATLLSKVAEYLKRRGA